MPWYRRQTENGMTLGVWRSWTPVGQPESRAILGSAEAAIAGKFVEAATIYAGHPEALQPRAINTIDGNHQERRATILIPSSMVDSLNPSTTLALVLAGTAAADAGPGPPAALGA